MMCPLCSSVRVERFWRRSAVPVHQNVLAESERAAREVARGDLDMAACEVCGFVFNAAFDSRLLAYGPAYENTQSHSSVFAAHMRERVAYLLDRCGVRGKTIVEIGCGRGEFLRMLVEGDEGNVGIGFDPSYRGEKTLLDGRLRFEQRMFGPEVADLEVDVVVCRHVIEHVGMPAEFLAQLRRALARSSEVRVFFETPCVRWILSNLVLWDFFYEHCSLFSAETLAEAFRRAGFHVGAIDHVFGDQYLWLEGSIKGSDSFSAPSGKSMVQEGRWFAGQAKGALRGWRERLGILSTSGRVAIWGAGAKGATFVDLLDRDRAMIDCVVDINPEKQGCFVPGTGHPIVAPEALRPRQIATALVMNPNYLEESRQLLLAKRISTELVT